MPKFYTLIDKETQEPITFSAEGDHALLTKERSNLQQIIDEEGMIGEWEIAEVIVSP